MTPPTAYDHGIALNAAAGEAFAAGRFDEALRLLERLLEVVQTDSARDVVRRRIAEVREAGEAGGLIAWRFDRGDIVEAQDPMTHNWRRAIVDRRAAYRGREGYYVTWILPADAPAWISRGGWQQGATVRPTHG